MLTRISYKYEQSRFLDSVVLPLLLKLLPLNPWFRDLGAEKTLIPSEKTLGSEKTAPCHFTSFSICTVVSTRLSAALLFPLQHDRPCAACFQKHVGVMLATFARSMPFQNWCFPHVFQISRSHFEWRPRLLGFEICSCNFPFPRSLTLKGHGHAILVYFKNQKYVLTSMNTHK